MRVVPTLGALVLAAAAIPSLAQAELIYGLTSSNNIVTFDSAAPGTQLSSLAITGILGGDTLTGIDLRPATGQIYSVGTLGNVYSLSLVGGAYQASLAGNLGIGSLAAPSYGVDFNPTVDRLRFITSTDVNLRINPITGGLAAVDTNIQGGLDIVGSAYTNNFAGATTTRLYGLDAVTDSLIFSDAPNGGVYTSVGPLGVDLSTTAGVGFDISGLTGAAYFNSGSSFYTVNLGTGAATLVGSIQSGSLVGLTAAGIPEPATWAAMILGFGLAGAAMRRRRYAPT